MPRQLEGHPDYFNIMFYLFYLNLIYMESISIVAQQQCTHAGHMLEFLVILASHQTIIDVQFKMNLHKDRREKCNNVTNLVAYTGVLGCFACTYKWLACTYSGGPSKCFFELGRRMKFII
ncbi:Hypothetical_protein [Hexamita inflata]|uniref:Hypothetical_protein n=1 Tax=Hexamita inflata TaxID=28002 RepID=A0AA86TGF3_9EUKA|nr:Hypothetical protein HINF_LOCUS3092 [Hexamita inflata]